MSVVPYFPCIPSLRPEQASILSGTRFLLSQRMSPRTYCTSRPQSLKKKKIIITYCFVSEREHFTHMVEAKTSNMDTHFLLQGADRCF